VAADTDAVAGGHRKALAFWLGTVPSRTLALISCLILFMMMALTFVDVGGRYLFNSPLPALAEIISFMMAGLVFGALPMVCFYEGHVTIDLFDSFVPRRLKRWQGVAVNVVSAAAMVFIAWRLWDKSMDHLTYGQATDELLLPLWPFSMGMAILSVVAAIAQFAAAGAYLIGVRDDPAVAAAGRAT
jgi:TRAP-type C4-dicarboxylate transport system permease small subunit